MSSGHVSPVAGGRPHQQDRLSDVVLVAGYAQLPQSTGAGVMWRHLTLIVRIDLGSGLVVDASTTLATAVADTFVRELLIGSDPIRDQQRILATVERHYFGNGRKAIVGALRDLMERYEECRRELG